MSGFRTFFLPKIETKDGSSWRRLDANLTAHERAELDARALDTDDVVDLAGYERAQAALSDLNTRATEAEIQGTPLKDVDTSMALTLLRGNRMTWAG